MRFRLIAPCSHRSPHNNSALGADYFMGGKSMYRSYEIPARSPSNLYLLMGTSTAAVMSPTAAANRPPDATGRHPRASMLRRADDDCCDPAGNAAWHGASVVHNAAIDILGAYKLTGNFHVNLEIVLKDMGVFDKVTYQIESNPKLSYPQDCRHVVFEPNENIASHMFGAIVKSIETRIGFDAPLRARLFRWLNARRRISLTAALPS